MIVAAISNRRLRYAETKNYIVLQIKWGEIVLSATCHVQLLDFLTNRH